MPTNHRMARLVWHTVAFDAPDWPDRCTSKRSAARLTIRLECRIRVEIEVRSRSNASSALASLLGDFGYVDTGQEIQRKVMWSF